MKLVSALVALAMTLGGTAATIDTASVTDAQPTRLALALPLTVPPQSTGLIPAESLELYTSPTGLLTRKLAAVEGQPVAIAIDPMIVASIRILGNTAPPSAIAWLQRLELAGNETFPLSYADSDVSALSQAGSTAVLAPTWFPIDPTRYPLAPTQEPTPTGTATPSPTVPPEAPEVPTSETITDWPYTIEGLLWPRPNTVTAADFATFNAEAGVTTILSSGNVTATPGASAAVDDHAVLVADEAVSTLLRQAVNAVLPTDWQAAVDQLAAHLTSLPGSATVLATFDRDGEESASRLAETISAVTGLADVQLTSLAETMQEPRTAVRIADAPVDGGRVSRVRLMLAAEALIAPFSSVLADPAPLTGERRLSLLSLSSNAWADPTTTWISNVDLWLERSNAIVGSVQIAESSTLNFFQDRGTLPIAVSNELDFPVTVFVTVRSGTGILVVTNSRVQLDIEAGSQARAFVPVQSIANGQATLQVSLSSATSVPVGSPKTVTANVVAGWETTATWVIAALLLALFIAGVVRTVLKRRRLRDGEPELSETGE